MVGMVDPVVTVDEFVSKMGEDDDITVLSFTVKDKKAADDLSNWFEKGYDFVLDSEVSPGEISTGKYLVFVELKRRTWVSERINDMLDDLNTLTDINVDDWAFTYDKKSYKWDKEVYDDKVPNSPHEYREIIDIELNEWRNAAGIAPKKIYKTDRILRNLQANAGII